MESLSAPITETEIQKAIKTLPSGKSPGPDGLTNDYNKIFQNILSPTLQSVYSQAMFSASFPSEMLNAYVVTIPKPGKELTTPPNFRPISLLNMDVKLYAKILAHRLLPILPTLIILDQAGFTSRRQASDATGRVIDIIHYARSCRISSLLPFLDAENGV